MPLSRCLSVNKALHVVFAGHWRRTRYVSVLIVINGGPNSAITIISPLVWSDTFNYAICARQAKGGQLWVGNTKVPMVAVYVLLSDTTARHLIIKTNKTPVEQSIYSGPVRGPAESISICSHLSILVTACIIDGGTERKSIYLAVFAKLCR